ncbi:MAG TPA: APA family fibronectin-binding glycoprotein [Mycobacterium sp.]|nr:APA family fibronectin-binding glycoprotein [Mycobacterium sp.]
MQHPPRRRSIPKALATAAVAGLTAVTLALPGPVAYADPVPPPPAPAPAPAPAPPAPAPAPAPVDPNAPPPPPADPNAPPPPPADPNAPPAPPPEPGRVDNAAGGFSYVVPAGWKLSDNTQLSYGQALLTKIPEAGAEAPSDTSVLLGRLDLKLFAGAETDNSKAATRLASDMGEFFMPFAGTRQGQEAGPLDAAGMPGAFSSYEVKFTDAAKPTGQIWAGVVGQAPDPGTPRGQRTPQRWFVVWLGSANHPVDKVAAATLAQSIRPFTPPPPPPPPAPDPNAPPPDPNAPAPRPGVGVPVPVTDAPPEMLPPA